MNTYRVTAQSYTSSQRVFRIIQAASEIDVLLIATLQVDAWGYVTDIKLVRGNI